MSLDVPRLAPGLKTRKHHNTKGFRQIREGRTTDQVKAMARRLGIPYGAPAPSNRTKEK